MDSQIDKLPIKKEIIEKEKKELGIDSLAYASIRNIVQLVNRLEKVTGVNFIRTEMGVPGLPAIDIGVDAEIEALKSGIASIYPPIEGVPEFKNEVSRFAKLFLDIEVSPYCCVPTTGSMQAAMAALMVATHTKSKEHKVLFIDPGFPVNKLQVKILGKQFISFDIYDYRGNKLRSKLEEIFTNHKINVILYSNPNNPSWVCLTEEELKIIGEFSKKHDVIVIEDLAYFGMDFRENYGIPGKPPYQPTIAKYTDNYVILISASKVFNYAGQRIAALIMSNYLYNREFPELQTNFINTIFGRTLIQDVIYALSAGTTHSSQIAFAHILKVINEGKLNFIDKIKEYGFRASKMKKIFLENGFYLVYSGDVDRELADGFYFTVAYPGMNGDDLLNELLTFGISAITLHTTGSTRIEGLRICVSKVDEEKINILSDRLKLFNNIKQGK